MNNDNDGDNINWEWHREFIKNTFIFIGKYKLCSLNNFHSFKHCDDFVKTLQTNSKFGLYGSRYDESDEKHF